MHGLEWRSMNVHFGAGRMIDELQHLRSKPIALLERVKVHVEGVVRSERTYDLDVSFGRRRLAVDIADGFGDAQAFRLRRPANPDVVAVTDVAQSYAGAADVAMESLDRREHDGDQQAGGGDDLEPDGEVHGGRVRTESRP